MLNRSGACRKVEPLLWDYQAGGLSESEMATVRAHLANCESCQAAAETYARAGGMFQLYSSAGRVASPADWQELEAAMQYPGKARKQSAPVPIVLALAAAALLFVALIRTTHPHRGSSRRTLATAANPPVSSSERVFASHGGRQRTASMRGPWGAQTAPAREVETDGGHGIEPVAKENRLNQYGHRRRNPAPSAATADEMRTINADPAVVLAAWNPRMPDAFAEELNRIEKAARAGDDFIYVPRPMLAYAGAPPEQRDTLLANAIAAYQKERQITDARLNRNVSIGAKSISFEDLCKQLKEKTEIDVTAARSVMDDKVTLFCKDQPVREIMRQINRVFGFMWARTGEETAYKYTLIQDLRSQLSEEEMRNRDLDEALLDIDNKISGMKPDPKFAQWGALQIYKQLSAADSTTLRNGGSIEYSGWDKPGARPLPAEIDKQLVKANTPLLPQPPEITYPDYHADLTFRINRSELGQLTLQMDSGVFKVGHGGFGGPSTLATGRSPSVAKPENAAANRAVGGLPGMEKRISLHPTPTCPISAERLKRHQNDENVQPANGKHQSLDRFNQGTVGFIHIVPADVWEEVHRQTGMPIIADSFSRLYRLESGTVENATLFDALNRTADAVGARWKKDGAFLQCRSTSFFWDRLKEAPNRLLTRWQEDSRHPGGLPLGDFLEMSRLTDQQLDSHNSGDCIVHCWGLDEWDALDAPMGYYSARPFIRFLAGASPELRLRLMQPEGVSFRSLNAALQDELSDAARAIGRTSYISLSEMPSCRYRMEYIPAGVYVWRPDREYTRQVEVTVTGPTAEDALAKARKLDPSATAATIQRSPGSFAVIQYNAQGEARLVAGVKTHLLTSPFRADD